MIVLIFAKKVVTGCAAATRAFVQNRQNAEAIADLQLTHGWHGNPVVVCACYGLQRVRAVIGVEA